MTAEVKVKLVGVSDVCVHGGAGRNVSTSSNLRGKQINKDIEERVTPEI